MKIMNLSKRQIIIITALLILFAAIGSYLYHTWHQPLGPPLELTGTPEQSGPDGTTTAKSPSTQPVCSGPPSMLILLAGVGSKNYSSGPADAIRLVRLDFQKKGISILALSPDLWVEIPNIENYGIKQGRLNQAYLFGTPKIGFYNGKGGGSELLARTLQKNFGLQPDHYIAMDLQVFRKVVDELGGVEVNLPRDLELRLSGETTLSIKKGHRLLTGAQAEKMVRARIKEDDYSRLDNQIMILKALAAKTITSSGIKKLPNLVDVMLDGIITDFSPSQIKKLICLADKINPERDITYLNLPRELLTRKRIKDQFLDRKVYAYTWEKANTLRLIENFQAGETAR